MPGDKPDKVISAHLQDCILRLAIESEDFLRLVRPVLAPELLTSKIPAELYQLCLSYWDTFRRPPGDHFHDEFVRFVKQKPEAERSYYVDYVQKIRALSRPELDYVLGRINDFVRAREFERAAIEFAELTARGEFTEAENVMQAALRSGIGKYELGLDYLYNTGPPLRNNPDGRRLLMRTGIRPLDRAIGGFKRGQFICWMGGYKGKKSWGCLHTAITALTHGLTVAYVSHEVTVEELETRADKMIGGLVKPNESGMFKLTIWNDDKKQFEETEIEPGTIDDMERVRRQRRRVRRHGGRLFFKKYPMGSVNMREIDRYMRHLEMEGFAVDVLINDYADIMAPLDGRKEFRHQLNDSYIYHKRLADERNILVVTATQIPDRAVLRPRISIKDFAEDRRKAANVDMALAICQTEEQKAVDIATILVVANRAGPEGFKCLVGLVPRIGQFSLWAAPASALKQETKEDT